MTEKKMKRVADSYTTQVQVLTQGNLNGYNRLFGGKADELDGCGGGCGGAPGFQK